MRFIVQTITKIPTDSGKGISHYEIDLVDDQMFSDWQSSITLRIAREDVANYYIGQLFTLAHDEPAEKKRTERLKAYFENFKEITHEQE